MWFLWPIVCSGPRGRRMSRHGHWNRLFLLIYGNGSYMLVLHHLKQSKSYIFIVYWVGAPIYALRVVTSGAQYQLPWMKKYIYCSTNLIISMSLWPCCSWQQWQHTGSAMALFLAWEVTSTTSVRRMCELYNEYQSYKTQALLVAFIPFCCLYTFLVAFAALALLSKEKGTSSRDCSGSTLTLRTTYRSMTKQTYIQTKTIVKLHKFANLKNHILHTIAECRGKWIAGICGRCPVQYDWPIACPY